MKFPAIRLPLPVVLLLLVLLCPPAVQPTAEADDGDANAPLSTLLVKVPTEHVQDLVAWTHAKGGRVVDTETMTRLIPVDTPEPAPAPTIRPEQLPVLASAKRMLETAQAAVAQARKGHAADALTLDDVAITARRMRLRIVAANAELVEAFRAALADRTSLIGRALDPSSGVRQGAVSRLKDGRLRAALEVEFASAHIGMQPLGSPDSAIRGQLLVEKAAARAGMQMLYASSARVDKNRAAGTALHYRDYQFQRADVKQLTALLHNLELDNMTVTELAYTRAPAKEQEAEKPPRIGKSKIRLALVRPLID